MEKAIQVEKVGNVAEDTQVTFFRLNTFLNKILEPRTKSVPST